MKAKVTLNCPAILIKHIQKNYKFSIVIPKCLFSRDVIIIVTPLPGAVTITTYLLIGHYKYWTPVPRPLLVISSSSRALLILSLKKKLIIYYLMYIVMYIVCRG